MSKKEKVTEQKEEKLMTKYDLKMQKREEAKKKAKKQANKEKVIGAVVVIALICFVAYFPISSLMAVKETYVRIDGEDISRVEYDYNYNVVKSNYFNQYGSYLSMFGLDITSDMSSQMYSDTMTWDDFFEQQAIASITSGKAMKAEAEASGFTYDVEEDYNNYVEDIKEAASQAGVTTKTYIKQAYGSYATMDRIEECIKESLFVNAYYNKLSEENAPSAEEIQAHYEADKNSYDSVDYYMTLIQAELPTEPTELADPAEETDDTTADGTYQPSEAEIEKAMADAKVLADAAEATVTTDGELQENARYTGTSSYIRDWLFDEARKEGDTTVIEDSVSNQYYVLSFVKRYLDETPSADMHIIMTQSANGETILNEWKNGEATEESFAALADKYNVGTTYTSEGGYYEEVTASGVEEVIATWLFDESRAAGDTTVVTTEDGVYSYVLYYVGPNEPEWKLMIRTEILNEVMGTYVDEISKDVEVDDFKGNLEYLEIVAAQETAAATSEATTETEAAETETEAE